MDSCSVPGEIRHMVFQPHAKFSAGMPDKKPYDNKTLKIGQGNNSKNKNNV